MKLFFIFSLSMMHLAVTAQIIGINGAPSGRAKLEVRGGLGQTVAIFGGESSGISIQKIHPSIGYNQYFDNTSRYIGNGYAAVQWLNETNGYMHFDFFPSGTANGICPVQTRGMALTPSQHLVIGVNEADAALSVDRNPGVDATVYLDGSVYQSAFNVGVFQDTYIRAGRSGGMLFINDIPNGKTAFGGFVGIGTSTPALPLEIRQVPGAGMRISEPGGVYNWHWIVSSVNGDLLLQANNITRVRISASDGTYSSVSDRRLKQHIQSLAPVLASVMRLNPVSYEMMQNNPEHKRTPGVIAQELEQLFPQLVTVRSGDTPMIDSLQEVRSVEYDGLAVVAVKAVQEQQQLIQGQANRLKEMDKKLSELERILHRNK